jgi:hypothetical protein
MTVTVPEDRDAPNSFIVKQITGSFSNSIAAVIGTKNHVRNNSPKLDSTKKQSSIRRSQLEKNFPL